MGCTTMSTESTGPARAGSSSQGIRRELKDATRGTEIMGLFKERGFVGDDESADSLLQHIARRRRLAIIPLQRSCENRRVRLGNPELASCGTATMKLAMPASPTLFARCFSGFCYRLVKWQLFSFTKIPDKRAPDGRRALAYHQ